MSIRLSAAPVSLEMEETERVPPPTRESVFGQEQGEAPSLAAKFKWMLQAVELKNLSMQCFFKKDAHNYDKHKKDRI